MVFKLGLLLIPVKFTKSQIAYSGPVTCLNCLVFILLYAMCWPKPVLTLKGD